MKPKYMRTMKAMQMNKKGMTTKTKWKRRSKEKIRKAEKMTQKKVMRNLRLPKKKKEMSFPSPMQQGGEPSRKPLL